MQTIRFVLRGTANGQPLPRFQTSTKPKLDEKVRDLEARHGDSLNIKVLQVPVTR